MTDKNKEKNSTFMQVIKLSEKTSSSCGALIAVTAIVACIDIIFMLINMENMIYMSYLEDFQLWILLLAKLAVYVVLILIEVFIYRLGCMINKLSSTIFKYDDND